MKKAILGKKVGMTQIYEDKLKTHTKDELKKWWKELNNDDRKEIESLPNYDEKIFLEAIGLGDDLDEE